MKRKVLISAKTVYEGSNGGATRSFCSRLEKVGHIGRIAASLFRVQKASARAKVYRGGIKKGRLRVSYRELSYEQKGKHIERLCDVLCRGSCGMEWGWRKDADQRYAPYVIYVDLPQGQVSFHSTKQFAGPKYEKDWDGTYESEERILAFCDSVLSGSFRQERDDAELCNNLVVSETPRITNG